jgi:hypothetical protein
VSSHGLNVVAVHPVSPEKNRNPCPPDFWTEKWTQKFRLPVDFRRFPKTVKNEKSITFNSLRTFKETTGTEFEFQSGKHADQGYWGHLRLLAKIESRPDFGRVYNDMASLSECKRFFCPGYGICVGGSPVWRGDIVTGTPEME